MTQKERDRLVVLKKAKEGLITQKQAASEVRLTERQVRRILRRLRDSGDKAVIHGSTARTSNRKIAAEIREKVVAILSQEVYKGFGPTLAAEYLSSKHEIHLGRETIRGWMVDAKLWRAKLKRIDKVHIWRQRRSCRGELVQWDTSDHDWLEGRGPRMALINMIDDATSRTLARFVGSDSTQENMRLLETYVKMNGRPVSFYTDKASLFANTPKTKRGETAATDLQVLPPTQIGRALQELGIAWIPAHSPQAKGRVERGFGTMQDRLVKGLRVAGAKTLEQANAYLVSEFLPWWNTTLTLAPGNASDAHRPLGKEHRLEASLSHVETRQVFNDYTIRYDGKIYQIERKDICTGLRGASIRVELRLDGSLAVCFRKRYLAIKLCETAPPRVKNKGAVATLKSIAPREHNWMKNFTLNKRTRIRLGESRSSAKPAGKS
jgi:DNA-binding Lrp family transcriptional regulator